MKIGPAEPSKIYRRSGHLPSAATLERRFEELSRKILSYFLSYNSKTRGGRPVTKSLRRNDFCDLGGRHARFGAIYTIFEGTSEIQRLIISRAISGVHIR